MVDLTPPNQNLKNGLKKLRHNYKKIVGELWFNSNVDMAVDFYNKNDESFQARIAPAPFLAQVNIITQGNLLYIGPPGTGKTELALYSSWQTGAFDPYRHVLQGSVGMTEEKTFGHPAQIKLLSELERLNRGKISEIDPNSVIEFQDWLKKPGFVVLDEVTRIPKELLASFLGVMESGRYKIEDAVATRPTGGMIATTNFASDGGLIGGNGHQTLPEAFVDRFDFACIVPPMQSEDSEKIKHKGHEKYKILEQLTLDEMTALNLAIDTVEDKPLDYATAELISRFSTYCDTMPSKFKGHGMGGLKCSSCDHFAEANPPLCAYGEPTFNRILAGKLKRTAKAAALFTGGKVTMSLVDSLLPYFMVHRIVPNDIIFSEDSSYKGSDIMAYTKDWIGESGKYLKDKQFLEGFLSLSESHETAKQTGDVAAMDRALTSFDIYAQNLPDWITGPMEQEFSNYRVALSGVESWRI